MSRTIVLHYHLFKNAGTSLDQVFKRNFGNRWVTAEFPTHAANNTPLVETWIRQNPEAVVFSSHTAMGPIPVIEGVRIITVMLLRDPVERIRSAYRFERNQDANTWGAELAKQHDLEGYVNARLARTNDRQCRNFQMERLASLLPGDAPELERAQAALDELSVVGIVEEFDRSLEVLSSLLKPAYPGFHTTSVRTNVTSRPQETEADARINALLRAENAGDAALWKVAASRLKP